VELSETVQRVIDDVHRLNPRGGDRFPFGNSSGGARPVALSPADSGVKGNIVGVQRTTVDVLLQQGRPPVDGAPRTTVAAALRQYFL